jgi:hypothetical protein
MSQGFAAILDRTSSCVGIQDFLTAYSADRKCIFPGFLTA